MPSFSQFNMHQEMISLWKKMQMEQPLVHCITNGVANNFVANVLLAVGASPAMIDNPYESADFSQIAQALSINTGTPTLEQSQAMRFATHSAFNSSTPWVLDPVGYGHALKWRSQLCDDLLVNTPNIIRGNGSEIAALAGTHLSSKGVDSTVSSSDVITQAQQLLVNAQCVAISGEKDYILSKEYGKIIITGGSALQPKVTAMGCALGAVCAAYHALTSSSALAATTAHAHFALAATLAEQRSANKLGHFQVYFIDALFTLTEEDWNSVGLVVEA